MINATKEMKQEGVESDRDRERGREGKTDFFVRNVREVPFNMCRLIRELQEIREK